MSNIVRSFIEELLPVWRARRDALRAASDVIAVPVEVRMPEPTRPGRVGHRPTEDHYLRSSKN
jgi:hypothetical protein